MTDARADIARIEGRRSTGVWGAVAGAVVVGTLLAYLIYGYAYLAVSSSAWPPAHRPDPPVLAPVGLMGVLLASAVPAARLGRPSDSGVRRWTVELLTSVLVAVGVGVLVAGSAVVDRLDLVPSAHAYDAAVVALHAFMAAVTAAGVAVAAVTGWEAHRLGPHPWVAAARVVTAVWWAVVVAGWGAVSVVVYGWPQAT